jgi:DNA-directed RNA polymerase specialized sigma24 family protein
LLPQTRSIHRESVSGYAVPGDFCRIFAEDMDGLYWLAFLLTGDHQQAEKCFVSGLEECFEGNRVFKEWARSWARRTIVQNAIRMIRPAPEASGPSSYPAPASGALLGMGDRNAPLAALVRLKTFERFVFVMSVLHGYSDQDCKALLGCSRQDLVWARARALEQIGAFAESRLPNVTFKADGFLRHEAA